MAFAHQIQGFDKVIANLNAEINAIKGRTMKGLIEAAIVIRRDMDKTQPLIPVDLGNLRASWFTTPFSYGHKFGLFIGFSANYAAAVHEMLGMNPQPGWRYGPGPGKKRWYVPRPGAGPKFFEYSVKRNKNNVLIIIQTHAKIK